MRLLDLTLPAPAENLALDEALLDEAETAAAPVEILRLWEPTSPLVVVGRSSEVDVEVDMPRCRKLGVPVLRRTSGGATIVTGPGCLMYAVVLSYELRPELRSIDQAHIQVLETLQRGISPLVQGVARRGTSDLAIGDRKFSGNSLRCRKRALLYHGTLLYDFDLALAPACLKTPPRMPAYREHRPHETFITNLPLQREPLRTALIEAWRADEGKAAWNRDLVKRLAAEKYSQSSWNEQR